MKFLNDRRITLWNSMFTITYKILHFKTFRGKKKIIRSSFCVISGFHCEADERFFRAFFSVVRQMPGYNLPRRGTARNLPKFVCFYMYCLFCVVLCTVCVQIYIALLPPGGNPIAVNKCILSYILSVLLWVITQRVVVISYQKR